MPTRAVLSEKGTHSARQGYPYPQKDKRSVRATKYPHAVSHFHHAQLQIFFEAGPANMGPLQVHPAEGALFSDGINIYLGAGVKEVHFCKFKK